MSQTSYRSRHQSAESTNETEDGEVVEIAIDEAGALKNFKEIHDPNDLKLSGKAHKKRLRAKQKERSDEEINAIVRKLGKAVHRGTRILKALGLGTI
jgi:hypothetical protein